MIKCETRKLGERSFVEAEGDSLQILSEAKLLFSELIRRHKLSPAAARFAVETAIEVCKFGDKKCSFSEYVTACNIADKNKPVIGHCCYRNGMDCCPHRKAVTRKRRYCKSDL